MYHINIDIWEIKAAERRKKNLFSEHTINESSLKVCVSAKIGLITMLNWAEDNGQCNYMLVQSVMDGVVPLIWIFGDGLPAVLDDARFNPLKI